VKPFHTDTGDIIGLYSLGVAECGGECQLASTATVYNKIVKTRPDIIQLLSSPTWMFDRYTYLPLAASDLQNYQRKPQFQSTTSIHHPSNPLSARRKGTSLFLETSACWKRIVTSELWNSRPQCCTRRSTQHYSVYRRAAHGIDEIEAWRYVVLEQFGVVAQQKGFHRFAGEQTPSSPLVAAQ
jgi:hypothetical protein